MPQLKAYIAVLFLSIKYIIPALTVPSLKNIIFLLLKVIAFFILEVGFDGGPLEFGRKPKAICEDSL